MAVTWEILQDRFLRFKPSEDRLDLLLMDMMTSDNYRNLKRLIKILLVLSHGQATVERGFSINKEVENMKGRTLIALRLIANHVNTVDGIEKVSLSKQLLSSCRMARQKYERYLEELKEREKADQVTKKRKSVLDEI